MKKLLLFALLSIVLVGCSKDDEELPQITQEPKTSLVSFFNTIDTSEISSKYDGNIYDIYILTGCAKFYKLGDLIIGGEIKKHYPESATSNEFAVIFKVAKNKSSSKEADYCVLSNRVTNKLIQFDANKDVNIYFTEDIYMRSFDYSHIEDLVTNFGAEIHQWN